MNQIVQKYADRLMKEFEGQTEVNQYLLLPVEIFPSEKVYGYIVETGVMNFYFMFIEKGFLPLNLTTSTGVVPGESINFMLVKQNFKEEQAINEDDRYY